MAEEIRLHLEQRTSEYVADGLSPHEARYAALRRFGPVEPVRELARQQRPSAWVEGLLRDARQAVRSLSHAPVFTAVMLLTLALGLGANIAMFSLVDTLLLRPSPYPAPQELVRIHRTLAQSTSLPHSLPDYRDLRDQTRTFASVTAFQWWAYSLSEPGEPAARMAGVTASADLFATLGVQPGLGRAFTAEEQQPGRDRVGVLSYDCWQRRFAADPGVIGRTLRLDGEVVTIIGVMPETAAYPLFWGRVEIWRPLRLSNDWRQQRDVHWLNLMARLRPGVTLAQAAAEADTIAARLARQYPDTNAGTGLRLTVFHESVMADTGRRVTWLTFGLAGLVLLIMCANLSSLQLARATAHARQYAVRLALGAPRGAVIRQSLVETMLLALVGGGLGLLTAIWVNRVIGAHIPLGDGHLEVAVNLHVLGFAFWTAVVAGAVFGAAPALIVSRLPASHVLKQQARGNTGDPSQHRLRHTLLVLEIALTLMLLGCAAVFLRGLRDFTHRDLGWRSAGLLTGSITLPDNQYTSIEKRRAFHTWLRERLEQLPGVEWAALASAVPITATTNAPQPVYVEGQAPAAAGREPLAHFIVAGPHFFSAIGARLVKGRLIPDDIRPDSPPVAVISESTARTLWPGEDPIGKRIARTRDAGWDEVIGVVRDVGFAADLGAPATHLQVYESLVREPWAYTWILVRSRAPEALVEPLRHVVAELDSDLPVDVLRTVDQAVDDSQQFFRLANQVLNGFAALALILSAIGLYGVISAVVVRRTSEFGVRLALGARPRDVLWSVLSNGLKLTAVGIVIGLAGAAIVIRILGAIAPALPTNEPLALTAMSVLLVAVAAIACWIPAYRATKVDPLTALRAE